LPLAGPGPYNSAVAGPDPLDLEQAVLRAADAVGGLMEFWGFKRNMGRMWSILYLSDRPLSAADLGERLQLSTGAVSMTLAELTKWGAAKKAWVPGERRDYYEPETSIWKMVSRVFRERELRQIHAAVDAFELAISALGKRRKTAGLAEVQRLDFALGRIGSLLDLARIGEKLMGAILAGEPVDASPLVAFRKDGEED
jgi:HTH-type transcriptional regulator, glycine betaine synthesis regulator